MTTSVITAITDVFTAVMAWVIEAVQSVIAVFYVAESGLTFLGVLALVALSISIFLLLMNIISNFLQLRG